MHANVPAASNAAKDNPPEFTFFNQRLGLGRGERKANSFGFDERFFAIAIPQQWNGDAHRHSAAEDDDPPAIALLYAEERRTGLRQLAQRRWSY
ncbi:MULTISPECIES: hypothetical protein [Rhizobium]|uniref:hypothetical protein n=1 Tax=Rhizobium TaxID=379 RepID=UPI0013AF1A3A|nr:hypothetical protein [Rhizobium lusitanum]NTJ09852.1 hypothetical protein [Rhizobium lusitanum]